MPQTVTGLSRAAKGLAWALVVLAAVALGVRFTIRDSLPGVSLLFYGFPLPVVAALLLLAATLWSRAGRRLRAGVCLVVAAASLGVWFQANYRSAPEAASGSDLRVLFWNVARGRGGWEKITDEIQSADADLIGLVEAAYHYPDPVTYWRRQFPDHSVIVAGGGLVLISKMELHGGKTIELGARSRCATAEVILDDRLVRLVLVDLEANPFIARGRLIERVEEIATLFPETPTLILGDFNTPRDSRGFDGLRTSYVNVYEAAGRGLIPTWPSVLPLLTLDHIWISPHFVPLTGTKKSSLVSDHACLWCDLGWRKGVLHRRLGLTPPPGEPLREENPPASPPARPVLG